MRMLPNGVASPAVRQTYPFLSSPQRIREQPMIVDAESYAAATILATNFWARTLADDEFVRVADGPEEAILTQQHAINKMFHAPGNQYTMWRAFMDVATYGLAWIENPVRAFHGMKLSARTVKVGDSNATKTDYLPTAMNFMRPVWRNINIFDFYPAWSSIGAEMKGGVEVMRMGAREFEDFALKLGEGLDKAALQRALDRNNKDFYNSKMGMRWKQNVIRQLNDADLTLPESYRPIQFFIFRGEVPWKPINSIERYRAIVVANDELIFDGMQPYYPHTFKPIQLLPFNGRPFGQSPAEVARYEQDELNTFRMLRAAAAVKTVNAPTIVDEGAFDDVSQFSQPASDQVIMARPGTNAAMAAQQMQFRYDTVFTAQALIAEEKQFIRQAVGIPDVLRGIAAGSRTTAFEVGELSATGNLPLDVRVDLIENEDLPSIARDVGQRWILAVRNAENPTEELRARLRLPSAEMSHLEASSQILFQGSQRFSSRMGQGGVIDRVMGLIAAAPGIAQFINMPQFFTDVLKGISPDAAERYILDPQSAIGQAIASEALSGGGAQRGVASPARPETIQ